MLNFRSIHYRPHTMKYGVGEKQVYPSSNVKDIELRYNLETDEEFLLVLFKDDTYLRLDTAPEEVNWEFDGIIIPDHVGTWYTIDVVIKDREPYFLLEHEEYGDEAAWLIVDNDNNVIVDEVFDDWIDRLEDALDINPYPPEII